MTVCLDETIGMAAVRIMMCPMYDAALVIPDVLAGKLDDIANIKR